MPGGFSIHKDCLHEVPNGAHVHGDGTIRNDEGSVTDTYEACQHPRKEKDGSFTSFDAPRPPPPTINGWIEDSEVTLSSWQLFLDEVYSEWYVPALPFWNGQRVEAGQTLYFFNDLQDYPDYTIIQPVLQYFGDSSGWSMQDYICHYNTCWTGSAISANPGDLIVGEVWMSTSTQYTIQWSNVTQGQWWWIHLDLTGTFAGFHFQTIDPGVLEAYSVTNCNQLPAASSVEFFGIAAYEGNISNWNAYTPILPYGASYTGQVTYGLSPSCSYGYTESATSNWITLKFAN